MAQIKTSRPGCPEGVKIPAERIRSPVEELVQRLDTAQGVTERDLVQFAPSPGLHVISTFGFEKLHTLPQRTKNPVRAAPAVAQIKPVGIRVGQNGFQPLPRTFPVQAGLLKDGHSTPACVA